MMAEETTAWKQSSSSAKQDAAGAGDQKDR
jgi:hypothetical protein